MTTKILVIPDTNLFLHYKRLDQIDWPSLLGVQSVALIIPPIVVRELERQKVHNPRAHLRARAEKAIHWLRQKSRDGGQPVRANVSIEFLRIEPRIDYEHYSLDRSIFDDQLIASALSLNLNDGEELRIATSDFGLELKLPAHGLSQFELSPDLKLPAEGDVEQPKKGPKLVLKVLNSDGSKPTLFQPSRAESYGEAPSLDEIKKQTPLGALPKRSGPNVGQIGAISETFHMNRVSKVKQSNLQISGFYQIYEAYLVQRALWIEQDRRTFQIELQLSNEGIVPATHIDIDIQFPSQVELVRLEDRAPQPSPPRPPSTDDSTPRATLVRTDPVQLKIRSLLDHEELELSDDGRSARLNLDYLKHHTSKILKAFYLRFKISEQPNSFHASFTISADETPSLTKGTLHFVLKIGGSDE